ncbi:phosphotransferase [Umezawaea sp. Da 62-37]|uniref:phosphotransferase n=1 Tax=Umezawaea sp. Da 62-37 TaxID=3075927 RepID=UPI0028F6E76D|nr:phosphotransferase [Umezawaea sp. Da 62-37]WNV83992.1 phosphotransferase [Umezawaea sp. Da 62-37]
MLTRISGHAAVSAALAALDDDGLADLLAGATRLRTGIGGTALALDVAGTRVFVKKVPLTELELRPENVRSTANLFGLPAFFQYGIGSAGFGAWRELAAHTATTAWVLAGDCAAFPLMHHWRVLPGTSPTPDEHDDLERAVEYWGGSAGVRARFEGLRRSPAQLVLFLEFLPQTVHHWLLDRVADGGEVLDAALEMVHRDLVAGAEFMASRGLVHFDAHFDNIMTDGERLYFADFGLTTSSEFGLSAEEAEFFEAHRAYDRCYTAAHLLGWFGRNFDVLPASAEALARHYAPVAELIDPFFHDLHARDRETPYPSAELERALAGLPPWRGAGKVTR